jgi:hypothetical protein
VSVVAAFINPLLEKIGVILVLLMGAQIGEAISTINL